MFKTNMCFEFCSIGLCHLKWTAGWKSTKYIKLAYDLKKNVRLSANAHKQQQCTNDFFMCMKANYRDSKVSSEFKRSKVTLSRRKNKKFTQNKIWEDLR